MITEWRHVYSSAVAKVGHDPETNELNVIWTDGRHSIYEDVSPEEFTAGANSWSVGKWIHNDIKPNKSHRYG